MGALSGATRNNFEVSVRTFARHLARQISDGILDDQEAVERLSDALMRAAKRGATHPHWFGEKLEDRDDL